MKHQRNRGNARAAQRQRGRRMTCQRANAPNAVTAIGDDLFADQVNLYTGGLEFRQTRSASTGPRRCRYRQTSNRKVRFPLPPSAACRLAAGARRPTRTPCPCHLAIVDIDVGRTRRRRLLPAILQACVSRNASSRFPGSARSASAAAASFDMVLLSAGNERGKIMRAVCLACSVARTGQS
jgi:hypothetical protein